MKLNLGCGSNQAPGYVNVDREPAVEPDLVADLEEFPWPFEDDSVEEVRASHVLEHLGADASVFIGIMQELYRVCRAGAKIHITVPHPRHDSFLSDPTHVRPITPTTMAMFSKRTCAEWRKSGCASTPLAVYANVDFELRSVETRVEPEFAGRADLDDLINRCNNVAVEYQMLLEVIK